ncbi:probable RNA-binding protein ARP1 isoform X1 [Ananas comosus]|uniref:Probable RNA-binding protein ARP1 isoform X1 n=1 Tax=Ananas comosus TaxID=4615 RepID=A0A6P5GR27_ANACO|nr:probable RNA-binding protein ARP1 isoform X1 [Ananas comosus]
MGQQQQQQQQQQFGDTTLTKVFVGGLAWETQKEALRDHFHHFGDILEAVIISDKLTGRSKGYGFVTFKEAEAAKKACEDATPVINGRRANCNLASLGAKTRLRPSPPTTPAPPAHHHHLHHHPHPHQPAGVAVGSRGIASGPPAPWYYQPSGTPPLPTPFHGHHHHYHGVLPFYSAAAAAAAAYGYSPYVTDLSYNAKLSHTAGGGPYLQGGQFSYPAHGAGMVATAAAAANGMVPLYPYYHYHHHQSQGMGVPAAHFFPPPTTAGSMAAVPAIISKPTAMPPSTVSYAVEQVTGCS